MVQKFLSSSWTQCTSITLLKLLLTAPHNTLSLMKKNVATKAVERLFPFVLRSRNLLAGRDTLLRNKRRLHFVLITTDLSENSQQEILSEFAHYPVVRHYQTEDLEKYFGLKGAKVVGFAKSGLAQSLYAELKQHRINKPPAWTRWIVHLFHPDLLAIATMIDVMRVNTVTGISSFLGKSVMQGFRPNAAPGTVE